MESYGGGWSSSNCEETAQRYELKRTYPELPTEKRLKKNKNKKGRVTKELAEFTGDNTEKDELELPTEKRLEKNKNKKRRVTEELAEFTRDNKEKDAPELPTDKRLKKNKNKKRRLTEGLADFTGDNKEKDEPELPTEKCLKKNINKKRRVTEELAEFTGVNKEKDEPELPTEKRLKKNKNKKRRVTEELAEFTEDNKEKDDLGVCPEQDVLTTSLDSTNYNGTDWESVIKNTAEEVNIILDIMVQLLGVKEEVALLQFELLWKSLDFRNDYMLLVLKALKKEYVYEQEECELLKKISDVEMTHMQLIRDAYTNLIKIGTDKGNKKQKMAEKAEEEENNNFDGKQLVMCIKKLQEIQDKLEKINEKARDEVLRIAKKYSEMCKPVYKKRKDIIKDIPNFWLTAFLRHPELGELVSTEDYEIFKFLSSIEVEKSKDVKSSYTITFYFNPNPHFKNTLLSKTYTFLEDGQPTKVTASTIRWSKGNGSVSRHAEDSFFRWFSSEVNQKDDEIAAIIKDELWQNPLTFFNEADEEKDEADDEVVKDNEHDGDEKAEEADEEKDEADDEVVKDNEHDGNEKADEAYEEKDEADDEVVKDNEHDGNEKADEADEEKDEADDEVVVDNEHDGDEKSDEEKDEADDEVVKDNEPDDNEKADEEKDKADDEVVKDNEHDGDEKADEEKDEADDEVVKDDEHDGDEKADEADEEDCEAAEDCGDEVVNDTEDDEEEADEDDLEGKDSEGSHDHYDLGGW